MGIVDDYIAHGWHVVAIPPGGKGPNHPGWNMRAGVLVSEAVLAPHNGVGLCHAWSGTMALDVDDWDRTLARNIDVDALAAAPDSVMIISGKPGHGKLLYLMPCGLRLPSWQIWDHLGSDPNSKPIRKAVLNFRCGTADDKTVQDVLPPSIHPETLQPYRWGGNGHWTRLPMIPAELLDYWILNLKDDHPTTVSNIESSWDDIHSAISAIDCDCSRDEWVQVGMALKMKGEETRQPEQAFTIWNDWSKTGVKYNYREMQSQWGSFHSNKTRLVTMGKLFYLAEQAGWKHPKPDIASLFGDISEMVAPQDILETMKAKPPDIDLSLWPPVLARRAQEVSDTVGCDPIVPLWAGLGAACAVVDAQSRLELDSGWRVPPVLWLMTIGDPGDRKSPGSIPMMEPLKVIEASDKARFAKDMMVWTYKQAVYASAHNAMMKYAGSPEGMLDSSQAPTVPEEPRQPVPLRFTIDDITSQQVLVLCQQRPRGMLCYFDEMNSWTNKLVNKQSGENRSAWVRGFESKPYELDRVKNGSTHVENFALSIYGNMQPRVLDENFTQLSMDGLLQRFLPAVVRHEQSRINHPIPEFMTSTSTWENTLRLTYAMDKTMYRLTPEAYQCFRSFQEWYEDRMHKERLMKSSGEFITAFGKITGLVGRLALMFHILENPWAPAVSAELMARVIRIAREYVIPTMRYVFDGDGSASTFDSWVMDYIIQHSDYPTITMQAIKRSAASPLEKAGAKTSWNKDEWLINAMYLLAQMKWVSRIDDKTPDNKAEWYINPQLKTVFKAYRDSVVQAKLERNADRLARSGSFHPLYVHGAESLDPVVT